MSLTFWAAMVIIALTVVALVKRYETRLVLCIAGSSHVLDFLRSNGGIQPICQVNDHRQFDSINLLGDGLCIFGELHQVRYPFGAITYPPDEDLGFDDHPVLHDFDSCD